MRIVLVPSTLRAGAKRCSTVAREAQASAQRIAGLPAPEGMPPAATAQLQRAVARLQRSAAAADRESQFLVARAQRGLLADGPFGSPLDLAGPQLLSPWEMPAKPKEHRAGGLAGLLAGAKDEIIETGVSFADTAAAIEGHAIDGDLPVAPIGPLLRRLGVPRPSDEIPYVGSRRKELDAAAGWAAHHPVEFGVDFAKDLSAWDEHSKGEHAHAFGRNIVGLASMVVPFTKAGAAGKAMEAAGAAKWAERAAADASEAARAAQRAAYVDRVNATVRQPGESLDELRLRRLHARDELTRTAGQAHLAEERVNTEIQKAREAAEHAAEARNEALKEGGKVVRDGTIKTLDGHDGAGK